LSLDLKSGEKYGTVRLSACILHEDILPS
jgi:hypothetical protein